MAACPDHFFTHDDCRSCRWETNHQRIQKRADSRHRDAQDRADDRTDRVIAASRIRARDAASAAAAHAAGDALGRLAVGYFQSRSDAKRAERARTEADQAFLATPAGKRHLEVLEGQRRASIDEANPDPSAPRIPAGEHTAMLRYALLSDHGRACLHHVVDNGLDETEVALRGQYPLEKGLNELVYFQEAELERLTHHGTTYLRVVLSVSMYNAMVRFYPPSRLASSPAPESSPEIAPAPSADVVPQPSPSVLPPTRGDLALLRALFAEPESVVAFTPEHFLLGWAARTSGAALLEVRGDSSVLSATLTGAGRRVFSERALPLDLSRVSTGALTLLDSLVTGEHSYFLRLRSDCTDEALALDAELRAAGAFVVADASDDHVVTVVTREARMLRQR